MRSVRRQVVILLLINKREKSFSSRSQSIFLPSQASGARLATWSSIRNQRRWRLWPWSIITRWTIPVHCVVFCCLTMWLSLFPDTSYVNYQRTSIFDERCARGGEKLSSKWPTGHCRGLLTSTQEKVRNDGESGCWCLCLKLHKHAEPLRGFPSFCRTPFLRNVTESENELLESDDFCRASEPDPSNLI